MNHPPSSGPEPERTRLRATVAAIEHEMSLLTGRTRAGGGGAPTSALLASWADLVAQLELGPEPEVRECPTCHHIGMRAATLCGYCWGKLTPPARLEEQAG